MTAEAAIDAWIVGRGSEPRPLLCPVNKCGTAGFTMRPLALR